MERDLLREEVRSKQIGGMMEIESLDHRGPWNMNESMANRSTGDRKSHLEVYCLEGNVKNGGIEENR